jgi:hypothetical protein
MFLKGEKIIIMVLAKLVLALPAAAGATTPTRKRRENKRKSQKLQSLPISCSRK